MKQQLDIISRTGGQSHQIAEGRIRSEKNPPAKGDTMVIEDKNSDGESSRKSENKKGNKIPNAIAKALGKDVKENLADKLSKSNQQPANINKKKTTTQKLGIENLDALVDKSTKLKMQAQKEALISSTDSGAGGMHKKPRQPKQRVETSTKVSSTEKEPYKATIKGKKIRN